MLKEEMRKQQEQEMIKQLKEADVEVQCNKCGDKYRLNNFSEEGRLNQGRITRKTTYFGYGSEKDGEIHEYCLCNNCEFELEDGFKIPVDIQDIFGISEEVAKAYAEMEVSDGEEL